MDELQVFSSENIESNNNNNLFRQGEEVGGSSVRRVQDLSS